MRYSTARFKRASRNLIASAIPLVMFSAVSAIAAGPANPFQVGAWRAGTFTNDQSGAFSHCSAAVSYKSNITMLVVVNRATAWSLGFAHPQWSLTKGDRIPIQLRFDEGAPYDETGVVLSPAVVEVPMPDNSQIIKSFRHAARMTAIARGQTFAFNLNGTSQLLPALVNCVRTALLAENLKQNNQSEPKAAAATDPNAIEEMQLATNFLLAARLSNARVIDRADAPAVLASLGATWKADNTIGAVKIYPASAGQSGLEFASKIIARDAQSCQGEFKSARSSELLDSDVVFRAATSCSESKGEQTIRYFITPWRKANFAVFAVMGTTPQGPGGEAGKETQESMFTKAVLGAAHK